MPSPKTPVEHSDKFDEYGWTPLHVAALDANLSELKKVIASLKEKAPRYAKLFAPDAKLLPVQILEENPHFQQADSAGRKEFIRLLEPITLDYKIIPHDQLLNPDQIHDDYPELKKSDTRYQHLSLAYEIINRTRKIIQGSDTHPDANTMDAGKKLDMQKKITRIKTSFYEYKYMTIKTIKGEDILANIVENIKKYRAGSCLEYALFAMHELNSLAPKISSEIYSFSNGDHVFLVMGRRPGSEPSDYRTWGESAIVCDPWGGYAILASQIPTSLVCRVGYISDEKQLNIIVPFDENYHRLQIDVENITLL